MDPIKCSSMNHKNVVPIFLSVCKAKEVTEPLRTKEEGKVVIESEKTVREEGYELCFSKAGTDIKVYLTKDQAAMFLNPKLLQ